MFQAQNKETKLVLEKLLCPPRSLWRRAWQDCISQHNTKPPRPWLRPIFWSQTGIVLRATVSDHITGLGSAVSSPAGFRAEPWPPKDFSLFSALRMASPDTIILYNCGSQNEKFLTHSIVSQLLCDDAFWCFLVYAYSIHSRKVAIKWWSSLQGRGEVDGGWGELDTWGNPPKQCRIKTTWTLAYRIK